MPKKSAESAPSIISSDKLLKLYTLMLQCRILESKARSLDRISSWKGKEAVAAAIAICLQPEDAMVAFSGTAIASFLKGTPLRSVLSQHAVSKTRKTPPGAQAECALATGIACSRNSVTVAFLSGRPEQFASGREALQFAGEHKLPILYVYSGPSVDAMQAYAYGFPVIPVDGNDAVAVYRVAHECIVRARQGGGPSVLACTAASVMDDPIRKMEQYLLTKGILTNELKQATIRKFKQSIAAAERALPAGKTRRESRAIFVV